jgi:hypothetical protein
MGNAELLQEEMNKFSVLKMKLKKERMSSTDVSDKECELIEEGMNNASRLFGNEELSEKDRDFMLKNYYDTLCERALTDEQISHIGMYCRDFPYCYARERMAKDPAFIDNLLKELKENGNLYKYFDESRNYNGIDHRDMIRLSRCASQNLDKNSISEKQYADIMTTILQHCQNVLCRSNEDIEQRRGCENILGSICDRGVNLSSYPKLSQAYIDLESECINHYARTLKSKRNDIELSEQISRTINGKDERF